MSNASSPSPPFGVPAVATAAAPPGEAVALPGGAVALSPAPPSPPTIADVLRAQRLRIDGWTPVKVAAFISHLGTSGSATQAAAYVQMSLSSCYALRNRPGGEAFAEAWETAVASRHEMLADIALDRVRDGVERIRWHQGQAVGVDRVFSDRLLIYLLGATDPDRRRARGVGRGVPDVPPEPEQLPHGVPQSFDSGISGRLSGPATDGPADSDLHAALAAELDDDLPPDVVIEMAASAERRRLASEANAAGVAAIGAVIDAALGRVKPV